MTETSTLAPFSGRLAIGRTQSFNSRGDLVPATVSVDVAWDGKRLSIQADVRRPGARDIDSGGQIVDEVRAIGRTDLLVSADDRNRLVEVWDRWHLNDMRAGSPAQEEWLRANKDRFPGYPISFYDWATAGLAEAGLQPDPNEDGYSADGRSVNGYRYGSAWLHEDVPAEVLDFLRELVS